MEARIRAEYAAKFKRIQAEHALRAKLESEARAKLESEAMAMAATSAKAATQQHAQATPAAPLQFPTPASGVMAGPPCKCRCVRDFGNDLCCKGNSR